METEGDDESSMDDSIFRDDEPDHVASGDFVEFAPQMPPLVLPPDCGNAQGSSSEGYAAPPDHEDHLQEIKFEDKQDITATIEHLIVLGNYYRHQHWRVAEWKRKEQGKEAGAEEVVGNDETVKDETDETVSEDDLKPRAKRKRCDGVDALYDVHAQDTRLYNEENKGNEPYPWPKTPLIAREMGANDRQWDEELSDGLHPIAFSKMRRTGIVPPLLSTNVAINTEEYYDGDDLEDTFGADFDIDATKFSCNVTKHQAKRVMLLQCWDRAVRAAGTTVDVSTAPTDGAQLSPPRTAQESRTRECAIAACQRLRIEVSVWQKSANASESEDPSHVDASLIKCFVCDVPFSSLEKLQNHFFGTPRMQGCCWILIDRRRREILSRVLESEVKNQMQQLLRIVLKDSLVGRGVTTSNSTAPIPLDCFDVLRILEDRLGASRPVISSSTTNSEPVSETLEVQLDEPPLLINSTLLEAVRFRLVDRYARVPR